jgi:nicotinate phosphoribosyltransferase
MPSALFTDLYELNMAQAYSAEGMSQTAVFEVAYRKLPDHRNYILASGLSDALHFLSQFHFTEEELGWLKGQRGFSESFVASLENLRFTGDVYAVPEGTPFFPNEPLLQVVAPVIEGQLVETALLNLIHFPSLALTKAARVVHAAQGRLVVDFGSRRAAGCDAALSVARATWLAGGHGTSNVLAGKMWGIPLFGTMAHSYIQAHETEESAFEAFASLYPGTTLLVDTYDSLEGVRLVVDLKRRLGDRFDVRAIRLDSGDLATLAREARRILDQAGLRDMTIFASSGLDEYQIARLVASGAPIDGFGVGTKLAVCADAPELDMAYKLVEYAGRGRFKLSRSKTVYPGRKQVFRQIRDSRMAGDVIGGFDEKLPGVPLLRPAMLGGQIKAPPNLEESRRLVQREVAQLPEGLQMLETAMRPYPVTYTRRLKDDLEALQQQTLITTGQKRYE